MSIGSTEGSIAQRVGSVVNTSVQIVELEWCSIGKHACCSYGVGTCLIKAHVAVISWEMKERELISDHLNLYHFSYLTHSTGSLHHNCGWGNCCHWQFHRCIVRGMRFGMGDKWCWWGLSDWCLECSQWNWSELLLYTTWDTELIQLASPLPMYIS